MKIEQISRLTHEADRAIRSSMGQEILGWDRLEATLKLGWRSKVAAFKGPDGITPMMRHESWVSDMTAAGWTLDAVTDGDKKTHPAICPYGDLPDQVHLLDGVFIALINACSEINKNG